MTEDRRDKLETGAERREAREASGKILTPQSIGSKLSGSRNHTFWLLRRFLGVLCFRERRCRTWCVSLEMYRTSYKRLFSPYNYDTRYSVRFQQNKHLFQSNYFSRNGGVSRHCGRSSDSFCGDGSRLGDYLARLTDSRKEEDRQGSLMLRCARTSSTVQNMPI